jgi:hypothetical protein
MSYWKEAGLQLLTAVTIFWDVTERSACCLYITSFLLFYPKDGGNKILRNVGERLQDYTA